MIGKQYCINKECQNHAELVGQTTRALRPSLHLQKSTMLYKSRKLEKACYRYPYTVTVQPFSKVLHLSLPSLPHSLLTTLAFCPCNLTVPHQHTFFHAQISIHSHCPVTLGIVPSLFTLNFTAIDSSHHSCLLPLKQELLHQHTFCHLNNCSL